MTMKDARRFVGEHHRHNLPPQSMSCMYAVGVAVGSEVVGVAIAGRPAARALCDGSTLEILRCCTDGTPNANSMLYGAMARAARALGYERLFTYTLADESGTSLRAAGWTHDADLAVRPSWDTPSRQRNQVDLFGNDRRPSGPKVRWVKVFAS